MLPLGQDTIGQLVVSIVESTEKMEVCCLNNWSRFVRSLYRYYFEILIKTSVEKLLMTKAKKKPSTRKVIHEQLSISLSRGKIHEILLTLQVLFF